MNICSYLHMFFVCLCVFVSLYLCVFVRLCVFVSLCSFTGFYIILIENRGNNMNPRRLFFTGGGGIYKILPQRNTNTFHFTHGKAVHFTIANAIISRTPNGVHFTYNSVSRYIATSPSEQTTFVAGTLFFQPLRFSIIFHSSIVPLNVMLVKLVQ